MVSPAAGSDPLWWTSRWCSGLRRLACIEIHRSLERRRWYRKIVLSGRVARIFFGGPWWVWPWWVLSLRSVKSEVAGLADRFGVDLKVEVIWSRG